MAVLLGELALDLIFGTLDQPFLLARRRLRSRRDGRLGAT
jgi:hypothetical protein